MAKKTIDDVKNKRKSNKTTEKTKKDPASEIIEDYDYTYGDSSKSVVNNLETNKIKALSEYVGGLIDFKEPTSTAVLNSIGFLQSKDGLKLPYEDINKRFSLGTEHADPDKEWLEKNGEEGLKSRDALQKLIKIATEFNNPESKKNLLSTYNAGLMLIKDPEARENYVKDFESGNLKGLLNVKRDDKNNIVGFTDGQGLENTSELLKLKQSADEMKEQQKTSDDIRGRYEDRISNLTLPSAVESKYSDYDKFSYLDNIASAAAKSSIHGDISAASEHLKKLQQEHKEYEKKFGNSENKETLEAHRQEFSGRELEARGRLENAQGTLTNFETKEKKVKRNNKIQEVVGDTLQSLSKSAYKLGHFKREI